ncbi:hypothetical protein HDU96_009948 [Phlyctochytrium bullatum]|nr:hypothetical protein HDU96_009948 [Phlyctochytrium bullatum]
MPRDRLQELRDSLSSTPSTSPNPSPTRPDDKDLAPPLHPTTTKQTDDTTPRTSFHHPRDSTTTLAYRRSIDHPPPHRDPAPQTASTLPRAAGTATAAAALVSAPSTPMRQVPAGSTAPKPFLAAAVAALTRPATRLQAHPARPRPLSMLQLSTANAAAAAAARPGPASADPASLPASPAASRFPDLVRDPASRPMTPVAAGEEAAAAAGEARTPGGGVGGFLVAGAAGLARRARRAGEVAVAGLFGVTAGNADAGRAGNVAAPDADAGREAVLEVQESTETLIEDEPVPPTERFEDNEGDVEEEVPRWRATAQPLDDNLQADHDAVVPASPVRAPPATGWSPRFAAWKPAEASTAAPSSAAATPRRAWAAFLATKPLPPVPVDEEVAAGEDRARGEEEALDMVVAECDCIVIRLARIDSLVTELSHHAHNLATGGAAGGPGAGAGEGAEDPMAHLTPLTEAIDANFHLVRSALRGLGEAVPEGLRRRENVKRVVRLKRGLMARRVVEVAERYRAVQGEVRKRLGGVVERYMGIANTKGGFLTATDSDANPGSIFASEMLTQVSSRPLSGNLRSLIPSKGGKQEEGPGMQELVRAGRQWDVEERRNREIRNIERSVKDLVQLFGDMKDMIDAQDSTLTAIETGVEAAETELDRGIKELDRAAQLQRQVRRRMWCLWTFFAICLVIVCVLVYVYGIAPLVRAAAPAGGGGGGGAVVNAPVPPVATLSEGVVAAGMPVETTGVVADASVSPSPSPSPSPSVEAVAPLPSPLLTSVEPSLPVQPVESPSPSPSPSAESPAAAPPIPSPPPPSPSESPVIPPSPSP